MAQVASTVRRRIDSGPLPAVVAVGDVVLIALWVAIGQYVHGLPPWEYAPRFVQNVIPFLIGWSVAAFVGGLYTRDAWEFPIRAVSWTVPAWLTAVVIAVLLRGTPVFPGNASPVFGAVAFGVGLVLLLPWRVGVALYDR
jgi:hypothetical protein